MTQEKDEIPEGMQRYTRLGVHIVGPIGLPDAFVNGLFESMTKVGAFIFDEETETLKPNPDMEAGKMQGLAVQMEDDFSVGEVRKLTDDEIKKDLGHRGIGRSRI